MEARAVSLILLLGILLATIRNGVAERRIVCYYTNWSVYRPGTAKFSPQNINPYLCTHLIYAFGGFTKDNALRPFDKYQDIEKGGYAKFTGLKTYNKNLKTMLAIGGWNEGSSRFSPMVADPARRREFVRNAVKFLRQNHFDGLDLDWEYPAFRDGGKPRDRDNYANLVQELREEFERESSKTGRPRLLLSMAMPAGTEYIDKGYDVPRLNDYLDFVNLLSYDYHSAYEPAVNHHSPLYPLEEDNEYNYDAELTIDYTINYLLEKGASADKIVLGIPTYGRSYTLFNGDAADLGSPADGPGVEGEATREKGYLAYYEICESIAASDEWEVVQPNPSAMGPYAFKGDQWVGYDDEDIVKLKARYANEKKLGGIMFWSIDNDDFRGKCHGRPYPLIEAAKEALLTENRNSDRTKSADSRKKTRTQGAQSNAIARKLNSSGRRSSSTTTTTTTTTTAPNARKRASTARPKYHRAGARPRASDEEQEDREVSRRSYDPSNEEDAEGGNTVRVTEKTERPRNRSRGKTSDRGSRRKQSRRKGQGAKADGGESLSNKLTTPEPPTTPDPGTDFKCEDEGFFPHPRDCKKYFWCLDSGPSGLGVVAHQFTCPSGLVFNKGADSCDYPRNVICPKSKTSVVSTTRSPITAATSRTTYLHSTTTAKAEPEEEYDEEEDYSDEDDEIEEESREEEMKEEPRTTPKSLVYKTLTRSKPSTTTTTTTSTTSRPNEPEKNTDGEDEEDPKVIKELIDLIKKAGGIEQLEKQLLLQEKSSSSVTPATISRSLYERVLNRQANKIAADQRPALSSSETSYVNGPGRAQFEGLDDIPEVKSLRRSQKPQYVTIERPKSATREPPSENEDVDEEDEQDDDVASGEEQSNPLQGSSSTQRATPSYVNIRRTRPSSTTSRNENDVVEKEVEIKAERPIRRRRPSFSQQQDSGSNSGAFKSRNRDSSLRNSEKRDDSEGADRPTVKDDDPPTTKSRYISIQRFRSTTSKVSEDSPDAARLTQLTSEITSPAKAEGYPEVSSVTASATTSSSTTTVAPPPTMSTSTEVVTVISVEPSASPPSVNATAGSTTESVKLVEDSATEILLTTVPASSSSQSTTTTTTTATSTLASTSASRTTIAAVSQPRPFGFTRRRLGTSDATTTTTTTIPSSNQARPKVADSEAIRLPTLKELIGYPTTYYYDRIATTPSSALVSLLLRLDVDNDISRQHVEGSSPPIDLSTSEDGSERELVQPPRETAEEQTGDSWLRRATENKAWSHVATRKDDVLLLEEQARSVTNAIQNGSEKDQESSISVLEPRPTTMRGIPLASLTPSPVMRGFYVTRSENDLSWTPSSSVARHTETTLVPDVSTTTTDEIVTIAPRNDRDKSERPKIAVNDRVNDIIDDEDVVTTSREENLSIFGLATTIPLEENLADHEEKPDVITNAARRGPSSKRGKSLRTNLDRSSGATVARQAIAKAVSRYNEFTTPLWTGRRIVARKRNRIAVSPIKEAIMRAESSSRVATPSAVGGVSVTSAASSAPIPATRRKFSKKIPTIPPIVSEPTTLPATSSDYLDRNDLKTEDSENLRAIAETMTLIDRSTTMTPSSATSSATASMSDLVIPSMFSDDSTTLTIPTVADALAITTPSTTAVVNAPVIATDPTFTIALATKDAEVVETTSTIRTNYSSVTRAIEDDSANTSISAATDFPITIASTATNTEVKSSSTIAGYSVLTAATADMFATDLAIASTSAEATSTITDYSIAATIPATVNMRESTAADSATTVALEIAAGTETETTTTVSANYSAITAAINANATIFSATSSLTATAVSATAPAPATTPATTTAPATTPATTTAPATTSAITTAPATTSATTTTPATTSNLADVDTVTTTASAAVITPTTTDPTMITMFASANIPSTVASAINDDTSTIAIDSETTLSISSETPITSTDAMLASAIAPTSFTTESSAIRLYTVPNYILDIGNGSERSTAVPAIAESTLLQTTESPVAFDTTLTLVSMTTAIPRSLPNTNSGTSTVASIVAPSSVQIDKALESTTTPANTETPPPPPLFIPLSIVTPITGVATLGNSTVSSAILATSRESTSAITQTTASDYEPVSIGATSEGTTSAPALKADSREIGPSRTKQTRTRDRTVSRLGATDRFGERTSGRTAVHRRVVNRPNDRHEMPTTKQLLIEQSTPRRRVTVYRGRPRKPTPSYASSSKTIEENRRRRISQKRRRTNSETTSSTIRSDEDTLDARNVTAKRVTYERTEKEVRRETKVVSKRVRERVKEKETTALPAEETTMFVRSSFTENETLPAHHEDRKMTRRLVLKRIKPRPEESFMNEETNDESPPGSFQSTPRASEDLPEQEKRRRKMKVVLKRVRPKSEDRSSKEANVNFDSIDESSPNSSLSNRADKNLPDEGSRRNRRMRVVLKSVRLKSNERNSTEEANAAPYVTKRGNLSSIFSTDENFSDGKKTRRRMKVVLKEIRPKSEERKPTAVGANENFIDENRKEDNSTGDLRTGNNLLDEKRTRRRRMRVVLKNVRPRPEKSATEEASDSADEDLQGNFSSKLYVSDDLSDEEEIGRRITAKRFADVGSKLKENGTTSENISSNRVAIDESLRGAFSSNFRAAEDPSVEERSIRPKPEEEEATTEQREEFDAELRTTETSVRVEGDSDRSLNEASSSRSSVGVASRRSSVGHSNRQRRPQTPHSTTVVPPLINNLPGASITHRRGRPVVGTTLSRIDLVDAFEDTEPYVRSADLENDQSIHAQEFTLALTDPPASSSDTGRAPLEDVARRKISTTISPRTDPTATGRTASSYGVDFRSRQRPRAKDRPTVNATTRPRRPQPIIDYDYYDENETPIVVGSAFLNSKLFLTSKGTIRCLDQGNFPHPYSCKKFITCARMVNGQVIGTEYTCPDKLSFDPIGGICNWSAGLGCKD